MFPTTTLVTILLAALAIAGPTISTRDDDGLVTFCFLNGSCFQSSAVPDGQCVDLPLFSEMETASVSAPGVECILSPDRGCTGNTGLTGVLLNSAGTVELSALGLSNVESYLCTSDVDLINLCFPTASEGCYQTTTVTNGCANLPLFSETFASTLLTTNGTECTLFENPDCAGVSTVITEALVDINQKTLMSLAELSVPELRAIIDNLAADIEKQTRELEQLLAADMETQTKHLKHLVHEKCAAQQQLNTLRDPISRVPFELSSAIFIQCLPLKRKRRTSVRMAPLLLLQICNAWTDISISTPALWTAIRLQSPAVEHLQIWLGRARNQLLSVSLNNSLTSETATLLGEQAERLENLEICDPNLGSGLLMSAECFPHLQTLTIEAISNGRAYKRSEVLRIFRLAPNLRSSPPLRNLALDDRRDLLRFSELHRWLQFVPTLTHLTLRTYHHSLAGDLIAALDRPPPEFLPNLQKLKIRQRGALDSYETLLRALTLRRDRITFCELEISDIDSDEPQGEVYEGLRELVASGMEINLGTKWANFLQ
ncbi:hypothetical protein B0H16DRAFT_1779657 [Mycena metata]|uniref:F-box domain-containing protein n=1 Tax=Mycena metata TaxID=1033252 RepID=A0AAD7HS97_9AGAR|nr:hypothetical protein B0H16DRAFT_1779657 [Mycena metata]